ncbi:MAG: quaternary ammonium compound efflux SMR transporter SugE [Methylophaga sp.]|jgi:quaternary ammonium compound-resistance protein SugE|nr:quaternary ammonium compound efflux SMR transporter SugE [Methylophaga sp.]MEC9314342.1 quaternary ammonium compound efflux SMR transporter SugE [Pseudomonadota bacterium]MED5510319.1 quaternary ammonium compound efflux SMR transporter SugE [Pseudomonadota bacterium]
MAWLVLFIAGLLEVVWAVGLKYSDGFTRLWPSLFTIVTMLLSFWLLGLAMRSLPVGTAYGVWVGIGAVGTVIYGIMFLSEPAGFIRMLSVGLILTGIVGLKVST